jgi:hypothetical protein
MTIEEKLEILNLNLNAINIHIKTLETDLLSKPDADMEGKPPRSEVLAGFREKKAIIENIIATLTEEETL